MIEKNIPRLTPYKGAVQRYQEACAFSDDEAARIQYQKDLIYKELYERQFTEQLIDYVTEEVMKRISVELDLTDVLQKIDSLNKAIDSLERR